MEPEVEAAIIKAASDWALLLHKDLSPADAKLDLESLQNVFRLAHAKIVDVLGFTS